MKKYFFILFNVGIFYENLNSAYNNIDHKKIPQRLFIIFLIYKSYPKH